jgi:predicted nucleic-acid-binding protein
MKIIADTNVLVRLFMADDAVQSRAAVAAVESASLVAISMHALCELCWVLATHYGVARGDIAAAIRGLADARNVSVNRAALDAGLMVLEAGGDFADGVIAFEGVWLGGEWFVSFDKKAVKLLGAQGKAVQLLG